MWEVLKRTVLHDAMPWVRLSHEHVRLPNGVEIEEFYRVDITPYVMIFAIREDNKVACVEHYKHGPQVDSVELPAGYIESDDPLQDAKRELREETGLVSDDWQSLGRHFIDGNRGCGWVVGYLARGARQVGEQQLEDSEIITLKFRTLDEVFEAWRSCAIQNVAASHLIGLSLLEVGYLKK